MKKKLPAYATKALQREAAGQAIDLVVIAVDDWERGKSLEAPDVARVVVPFDVEPDAARLDWLQARDVLLTPDCARAMALSKAAFAELAASVWLESNGEIARLCQLPSGSVVTVGDWVASRDFRARLTIFNEAQLLIGSGIFAGRQFDRAREQFKGELGLA